ncbi:MAG: mevalonate kinase [Kiritimatiellae bacterium]|nr:mevalonate kinase [Kiritimatiellia bacterium]
MAHESYKASAPGNLMLLGEHAVLYNHLAMACAVTRRISIRLTPRTDTQILLVSALGNYRTDLDNLENKRPFQFVLNAIEFYSDRLSTGFDLKIESEFSDQVGLGSSAAVSVATHAVLRSWLEESLEEKKLFTASRQTTLKVQGIGSGADVAASVYGGIVAYRMDPLYTKKLDRIHPITVVYSGYKEPTVKVIEQVRQNMEKDPARFDELYHTINQSVHTAVQAINDQEWLSLGILFNVNHGIMEIMGVHTDRLDAIVKGLRSQPDILGAKISGSGLGDCVVGLGMIEKSTNIPGERLDVDMSSEGVRFE